MRMSLVKDGGLSASIISSVVGVQRRPRMLTELLSSAVFSWVAIALSHCTIGGPAPKIKIGI